MRHNHIARAVLLAVLTVSNTAAAPGVRTASPPAKVPPGYQVPAAKDLKWDRDRVTVKLTSRGFSQGDIVYVEITPRERAMDDAVSCEYRSRPVLLAKYPWGYRGFFGIAPADPPGPGEITVLLATGSRLEKHHLPFTISTTRFPVLRKTLNVGKYTNQSYLAKPEVSAFIKKCADIKKEIFARATPNAIGARFSHPRDEHYVTSSFWMKRLYQRFTIKKGRRVALAPQNNTHRGIDLRGKEGAPIFAIADGVVAYADTMFYEGNFTVIDHGNRIFSYYMHQSKINVKTGDAVKAGDVIGLVGSTGISTGAHLHVSLVVNGVQVDPLSVLPIRARE